MIIPYWLVNYLTVQAYSRVSQAITEAEAKTHAEIIPMIVRTSWAQATLLYIFLGLMLFLIFLYSPTVLTIISISSVIVVLLYFREQEIAKAVRDRARIEFLDLDLNQTADRQGCLLFVSMVEKKVEIVVDSGLVSRITPEQIDAVRSEILAGIKQGELGISLVRAINQLGQILSEIAPQRHLDIDEVNNTLIIKE